MKKILNIIEITLLVIGVAGFLYWLLMPGDTYVDVMIYIGYAYIALATAVVLIMTAMNMGKSRNNSRIGLYVGAVCVVCAVIFYFVLSSSTPVVDAGGTVYDNPFELKISDAMIYLAYTVLGGGVVLLLGGEVWKAFK